MKRVLNFLLLLIESLRLRTQLRTWTQDVRKSTSAHARQDITFLTAEFGSCSERRFLNFHVLIRTQVRISKLKYFSYFSSGKIWHYESQTFSLPVWHISSRNVFFYYFFQIFHPISNCNGPLNSAGHFSWESIVDANVCSYFQEISSYLIRTEISLTKNSLHFE